MEEALSITRSEKIQKFPEKFLLDLEDKQTDLIIMAKQNAWLAYRKRRLKPLLLTVCFGWLIVPLFYWSRFRSKLPEWHALVKMEQELVELQKQRQKRKFWKKIWTKKNRLLTKDFEAINQFYRTLIHSIRQYNIRLDLFDYSLDRQNKKLDTPFTVGELEQIELTFQRIFDELSSAVKLLEVAEEHPEMDLATLLSDKYAHLQSASDFVAQTVDIGNSGQFVQDLLIIETSLKKDIAHLSKTPPSSSKTYETGLHEDNTN